MLFRLRSQHVKDYGWISPIKILYLELKKKLLTKMVSLPLQMPNLQNDIWYILTLSLSYLSDWWRMNFFTRFLTIFFFIIGRTAIWWQQIVIISKQYQQGYHRKVGMEFPDTFNVFYQAIFWFLSNKNSIFDKALENAC